MRTVSGCKLESSPSESAAETRNFQESTPGYQSLPTGLKDTAEYFKTIKIDLYKTNTFG